MGVTPDSTVYMAAAQSLLDGRGMMAFDYRSDAMRPLTHFPPLYPTLLALAGWPGRDPLQGARWLNALLLGATILLVGLATRRFMRSSILPFLASFLVLTSPDLLKVHAMVWSEPLFLFTSLLGLVLLAAYLKRPGPVPLFASALAIALAFLTRYIGATVFITGVLAILLFGQERRSRRLRDAASFSLVAGLPMAVWLARNALVSDGAIDRVLQFHPIIVPHLAAAAATVSSWPVAGRLRLTEPWALVFLAQAAAAGLLITRWMKARRSSRSHDPARFADAPLAKVLATFVLVYLGLLVINAWFFELDSLFDDRALSPVHVSALVLAFGLVSSLLPAWNLESSRGSRLALTALCVLVAGAHVVRGTQWVMERSRDGKIYTSSAWRQSETIARVESLPPGTPIFSNAPDAVYFLAHRTGVVLPPKYQHGTGRANRRYDIELEEMRKRMASQGAAIVLFDGFDHAFLPSESELKERLPLRLLTRCADGAIYLLER